MLNIDALVIDLSLISSISALAVAAIHYGVQRQKINDLERRMRDAETHLQLCNRGVHAQKADDTERRVIKIESKIEDLQSVMHEKGLIIAKIEQWLSGVDEKLARLLREQ